MCGIICIFNKINLDLMQNIKHRGQESYGLAFFINAKIILKNFIGKMPEKIPFDLNEYEFEQEYNSNPIKYIIGHTRYSTSGKKENSETQSQPLMGLTKLKRKYEHYMLVHNGNISNREGLKRLFKCDIDERYSDTQILLSIINNIGKESWIEIFTEIVNKIPGVYNLIVGTKDKVYVLRDSYGVRPLSITKEKDTDLNYCIISEPNEITKQNYEIVRDVKPAELVILDNSGLHSIQLNLNKMVKFMPCVFEYIYFSSKNSIINGVDITNFRYNCGKLLAKRDSSFIYLLSNKENIIVVGAPETGITSGLGYSDHLNLNYHQILYKKNKGRTFILDEKNRKKECKIKYGIIQKIVKNKIVIVLDDSLVRGNTMKVLVEQLKQAGVLEIHIRIASPPVISPCYYGIDVPTYNELIAHKFNGNIENINTYLGSNTLKYLSIDDTLSLLPDTNKNSCISCFTNNYDKNLLEW